MHSVDGVSGESQQGRQQGERGGHDQQHGGNRPDGEPLEEGQLKDEEADQGDDHGGPGKQDGAPRGGQRVWSPPGGDRALRTSPAGSGVTMKRA